MCGAWPANRDPQLQGTTPSPITVVRQNEHNTTHTPTLFSHTNVRANGSFESRWGAQFSQQRVTISMQKHRCTYPRPARTLIREPHPPTTNSAGAFFPAQNKETGIRSLLRPGAKLLNPKVARSCGADTCVSLVVWLGGARADADWAKIKVSKNDLLQVDKARALYSRGSHTCTHVDPCPSEASQ